MKKIIEDRQSTIVSLIFGTGAGWGFDKLITAKEIQSWLITIAVAVSLFLSLVISISLPKRLSVPKIKRLRRRAIFVFASFLVFIALFFISYQKYTISIPTVNEEGKIGDSIVVKGLSYTASAKKYRDSLMHINPDRLYPTDDKLLEDATYNIQKVWPDNSRTYCKLLLLFVYTIMICLFIAGITLTTEIIIRTTKNPPE